MIKRKKMFWGIMVVATLISLGLLLLLLRGKVIYQQSVGGMCVPDQPCTTETTLYSSGLVVETGLEESIDFVRRDNMDEITALLREVLTKSCPGNYNVFDIFTSFTISLDGKTKTVDHNGCFSDWQKINQYLDSP